MRVVLGILLIVGGLALGLYVGGYLMFIGGIIQIVDTIRTGAWAGADIAWGIARIVCASVVGVLSALLPISAASAMLHD